MSLGHSGKEGVEINKQISVSLRSLCNLVQLSEAPDNSVCQFQPGKVFSDDFLQLFATIALGLGWFRVQEKHLMSPPRTDTEGLQYVWVDCTSEVAN